MSRAPKRLSLALLLTISATVGCPRGASAATDTKADEAAEVEPQVEGVLLGRFFIRDVRGAEGVSVRISFALYAAVDPEQADAFRAVLTRVEKRLKSEVLVAVRMSRLRDFQEPDLARFRRRTLLRLRRTTPELPIDRLLIGEFEYFVDQR